MEVSRHASDAASVIGVLVPYDRAADYTYLDAIGSNRQEAISHFTYFGRFDLSLSEIFHMEFIEAELFHGGATCVRSDVMPCLLPVSKAEGELFPMGVSDTEGECRRILALLKRDPEDYRLVSAGLRLSNRIVL